MNVYSKVDRQAQDSLLDSVEEAIDERTQTGRADEARHGVVARVANAAPPANEAFRLTLRARILAKGTEKGRQGKTSQGRAQPARLWRFALWPVALAMLAAILVAGGVALTRTRSQIVEWNDVPVGRPGSGAPLTSDDLDALAEALNSAPAPRTVVVYPDPGSPIVEHVRHEIVPLALGEDTTPAAIRGALGAILPASGFVDVVVAGARDDDTTRRVRAVVEQTLYRLYRPSGQAEAEAYGALERSTFVAGPAEVTLRPVGAVFAGGIELVAGGALDDPEAGEPLRMAFDWRIQEPVGGSPVMFVHLVRDGAMLVAQRDAVPGNGLFPVEAWRPGEVVRDQFALLLPPTLPAGAYEVRVGIYDAATQMRYSLIDPEGGTYAVVQQLDVQ